MQTRDGRQSLRVQHAADIVVTTTPPPAPEDPAPGAPRRTLAIALVAGLVLVLVLTLVLIWVTGGDDDVTARAPSPPAAQEPQQPPALSVSVRAPETVVAGQPAEFVVTWSDGSGVLAGSTEDWGDDVGASSVREGRCEASAPAEPAGAGEFAVSHTWAEPGTYAVVLGVTTTTCSGGATVREDASATVDVTVLP